MAVGGQDSAEARLALGTLCELYWPPLYSFLRRSGCDAHEAEDVLQGYFARLIEKGDLAEVAPEKGRLRSFMLATLKHYLANERGKARALKRGGGRRLASLDVGDAESAYRRQAVNDLSADHLFERHWALSLLERVRDRLREEYASSGKSQRFELLEPLLNGEASTRYGEIARQLNLSENGVKVAAHRLRNRFRELLRHEIAQTVESDEQINQEIRTLFEVLRR